eukprot:2515515-Amphidinium_carterae.1
MHERNEAAYYALCCHSVLKLEGTHYSEYYCFETGIQIWDVDHLNNEYFTSLWTQNCELVDNMDLPLDRRCEISSGRQSLIDNNNGDDSNNNNNKTVTKTTATTLKTTNGLCIVRDVFVVAL